MQVYHTVQFETPNRERGLPERNIRGIKREKHKETHTHKITRKKRKGLKNMFFIPDVLR